MKTAAQEREMEFRQDLRKHEAQAIGYAIFDEIRELLPREVEKEVHERLLYTLYRNGVMLVRDDERDKLGLEPRDDKGWTPSERISLERDRISAMARMSSIVVNMPENEVPEMDAGRVVLERYRGGV